MHGPPALAVVAHRPVWPRALLALSYAALWLALGATPAAALSFIRSPLSVTACKRLLSATVAVTPGWAYRRWVDPWDGAMLRCNRGDTPRLPRVCERASP
jgi:hypothetical protein